MQFQRTGIQTGSIQQIIDHNCETIGFLFDDGQGFLDDILVPVCIRQVQRRCVSFDDGDRRFQFMADRGNKGILQLIRFLEFRNVPDQGNDVHDLFIVSRHDRRI